MEDRNWKYKICTTPSDLIVPAVALIVFGGAGFLLRKAIGGAVLFFYLFTAICALMLLYALYRLLFVKMYIDDDGFYCQTGIGSGKFYKISDIAEASQSGSVSNNSACFTFKTNHGDNVSFRYAPHQSEGIEFLTMLINGEDPYAPIAYTKITAYENGFLCADEEENEDYFKFSELDCAWIDEANDDSSALFGFTTKHGNEFCVSFAPEQRDEINSLIAQINGQ